MSSYFVAKHGVVSLTRSLGVAFVFFLSDLRFHFVIKITFDYQRERGTGVEHMAICPAFAETEVTLDIVRVPNLYFGIQYSWGT